MSFAVTSIRSGEPSYVPPSVSSAAFPDTQLAAVTPPRNSPEQLRALVQGSNEREFKELEQRAKVIDKLANTFNGKGDESGLVESIGELKDSGTFKVPSDTNGTPTFNFTPGEGGGIFSPNPQPDAQTKPAESPFRAILDRKVEYTKPEADFAASFYQAVSEDFERRYGTKLPDDKDGFARAVETLVDGGLGGQDLETLLKARLILQSESEAGGEQSLLGTAAERSRQIYLAVMGLAYGEGNASLYNRPSDEMFSSALGKLIQDGTVDQDGARVITAAYSAYKTIDLTIQTFAGTPGAAGAAVDNLNLLLNNLLPQQQAAEITSSISKLKTAYVTVQNVVNGAQGEPNAYLKAASALFTDPNMFGGDFARTAGQIVAGYKLVQNVVNFANNEVNAGQKALDAVGALAATGVISQDLSKTIQAVGATYKLTQNTINAFNGEAGAGAKALNAADLLGKLGVLGPEISNVITTGVKAYTAVDSVINLIRAPGIATGLGAVGAIAGLIGGQTASTIANIATLGFGIATGGIGAIIGGVVGLLGGLFGGGKKFTTISEQLDVTNDGVADKVKFESKKDDWWYYVDAGGLSVNNASFEIIQDSNIKVDEDGRRYYEYDDGDGIRRSYGRYDDNEGGRVLPNETFTYRLKINYNFNAINDARSLEMPGQTIEVNLSQEQYNDLVVRFGASGTVTPGDGRYEALRPLAAPGGELRIKQEKKDQGMTWYEDVNSDGVRDRITKYVSLGGRTGTDDSTYIELRNAQGQTWLAYALDANGNATNQGHAAHRLNLSSSVSAVQLLGLDPARNLGSQLGSGANIVPGQYMTSPNGRFAAIMGADGNFVLYNGNSGRWATGSENRGGQNFAIQTDGNLVIYTPEGRAIWSSKTDGRGPVNLVMQDDGNLVAYQASTGRAVWSSKTDSSEFAVPTAPGGVGWLDLGGTQIYGAVDWSKKPLSAQEQLSALQYIASSPDLIAAFGANAGAGYKHLMTHGATENRPVTFDPAAYMAANPDVAQAYGGDALGATQHYIQHGFNENRVLSSLTQDTNNDGTPEQVRVFRDRVEITGVSASGVETVSRYTREGAFVSAVGDFDNDGLRDETTLNPDGSLTVRALEGELLTTRILSADGALLELRGDFNGDGVEDVIQATADGAWAATLKMADGSALASGSGASMEDALRAAVYGTADMRLSALQYIASNPDLIASLGTDWERGSEHMMTRGASEGRQSLFDARNYLELNPDLAARFGDDLVAATEYYIQDGFRDTDRVIRNLDMDVDGDNIADAILIRPRDVTIGLRDAEGSISRVVQGESLEEAVAQANIIGILSWIAADDTRIASFGVDIVGAQRAIGQDKVVGDSNASLNLIDFVNREGARVQYFNGDLINILASYIIDRAAVLQSGVKQTSQRELITPQPTPPLENARNPALSAETNPGTARSLEGIASDERVSPSAAAEDAYAQGSKTEDAIRGRAGIVELLDAAKNGSSTDDGYLLIRQALGLLLQSA